MQTRRGYWGRVARFLLGVRQGSGIGCGKRFLHLGCELLLGSMVGIVCLCQGVGRVVVVGGERGELAFLRFRCCLGNAVSGLFIISHSKPFG